MKALSEEQKAGLTDYLSRKPKKCTNCGATDWEFGEIEVFAAELVLSDSQKVEPESRPVCGSDLPIMRVETNRGLRRSGAVGLLIKLIQNTTY